VRQSSPVSPSPAQITIQHCLVGDDERGHQARSMSLQISQAAQGMLCQDSVIYIHRCVSQLHRLVSPIVNAHSHGSISWKPIATRIAESTQSSTKTRLTASTENVGEG
jgi:hypothetical protein